MISRRSFIATATKLAIGGAGLSAVPYASKRALGLPASGEGLGTIRLEAREVRWELAPGKTVKAMAYNGQIPGPMIRAREGERLRVALKNSLTEPTTVHWHGVDVPNAMDGVPGLTQEPVPPGGTFAYEFEAKPAGTRWYHTHFDEHRQMDLGLVAPLNHRGDRERADELRPRGDARAGRLGDGHREACSANGSGNRGR